MQEEDSSREEIEILLFLLGSDGEDMAVESPKNGASDYIIKDRLRSLGIRVQRALKEAADRKKQAALENNDQETIWDWYLEEFPAHILLVPTSKKYRFVEGIQGAFARKKFDFQTTKLK